MLTRKARFFIGLTAAVPLLFAAACTDNGVFNPGTDAFGTYRLSIFADRSIPVTFAVNPGDDPVDLPNGGTWNVHDGSLVLRSDGTFTETDLITKTPNGGSSFESDFVSDGNFQIFGDEIDFSTPEGRSFTGIVSARRINYTEFDQFAGVSFNYEYRR